MHPVDRNCAHPHVPRCGRLRSLNHLTLVGFLLAAGPVFAQVGERHGSSRAPFDRGLGEDSPGPSRPTAWERLTPAETPAFEDAGEACGAPGGIRLLTWNVGTVVPHTLSPLSRRLPSEREDWVAGAIQRLGPQVVTLQEVQGLKQIGRLRRALLKSTGVAYSAVTTATTRLDFGESDGRMIATLYRGQAREVVQFKSESGYRTHALVLPHCTVINVHGPSASFASRKSFYAEVAAWARTLPQPVIVAGDFNLGPDRGAGLAAWVPQGFEARDTDRDTFRLLRQAFPVHTGDAPTTNYGGLRDHVMLTSGRLLLERVIPSLTELPMDHYPLSVYLDLGRPSSPARSGLTSFADSSRAEGEEIRIRGQLVAEVGGRAWSIVGDHGIRHRIESRQLERFEDRDLLTWLDGRALVGWGRRRRRGEEETFRLTQLLSPVTLARPVDVVVVSPGRLAWPGQDRRVEADGPGAALLGTAVGRRVKIKGSVEIDLESGEVVGCYVEAVEGHVKAWRAPVYDSSGKRTGYVYGAEWLHGLEDGYVRLRDAELGVSINAAPFFLWLSGGFRDAERSRFSLGSKAAEADFPELSSQTAGLVGGATRGSGGHGLTQTIRGTSE